MKNYSMIFKSILGIAFIFCAAFVFQSCAKKITFGTSDVVPAAEGFVKVKKDANNNYNIDLTLKRLADPSRLSPPKKTYIVWMETDGSGTKKIGQLNTSSSFLSNTLKSSLKTVSPFQPTKIFITGEDDGNIEYPDGPTVLSTANF